MRLVREVERGAEVGVVEVLHVGVHHEGGEGEDLDLREEAEYGASQDVGKDVALGGQRCVWPRGQIYSGGLQNATGRVVKMRACGGKLASFDAPASPRPPSRFRALSSGLPPQGAWASRDPKSQQR